MKRIYYLLLILLQLSFACSPAYKSQKSKYNFTSTDSRPHYNQLDYWSAHPDKWDPSDSVPQPLKGKEQEKIADVFFIHPTTYTKKQKDIPPNATIDDADINAKTDYSTILYQASAFNEQSRIFAPRYRQAHLGNFFSSDTQRAAAAFKIAYEDVRNAFVHYLKTWNNKRPIIIAAHSQGSFLAINLLKEFFDRPNETNDLNKQLVAAYIVGWPVYDYDFYNVKICDSAKQTACICTWRTVRNNFIPYYLKNETKKAFVTNPKTWTTASGNAPRQLNKGAVLLKFNKIYKHTTNASINKNLLNINKPKFPFSFLLGAKNYHIGDINLFYVNIRDNVKERLESYLMMKK